MYRASTSSKCINALEQKISDAINCYLFQIPLTVLFKRLSLCRDCCGTSSVSVVTRMAFFWASTISWRYRKPDLKITELRDLTEKGVPLHLASRCPERQFTCTGNRYEVGGSSSANA